MAQLNLQDIKTIETVTTLGNYSEKGKEKYKSEKLRKFYNKVIFP